MEKIWSSTQSTDFSHLNFLIWLRSVAATPDSHLRVLTMYCLKEAWLSIQGRAARSRGAVGGKGLSYNQ